MATHAPDSGLRIVLVDYFNDQHGFNWHMRALIVHGGGSQWVAATPDHELELLDLSAHRVIPLRRGEEFPQRVRGEVYAFDEFDDGEEDAIIRQANEYAAALGFAAAPVTRAPGVWRVSDTAHTLFGELVPEEALNDDDTVVIRGAAGLACIDDEWITMEKVDDPALDAWRARPNFSWPGARPCWEAGPCNLRHPH